MMIESNKKNIYFYISIVAAFVFIVGWTVIVVLDFLNIESVEHVLMTITQNEWFKIVNQFSFFIAICVPIVFYKKMKTKHVKIAGYSALLTIGFNVLLKYIT